MTAERKVAVGIITCCRPKSLMRLLESLARQTLALSPGGYELLAIVVDNDLSGENGVIVADFISRKKLPVCFVREPEQGIPLARNACVRAALDENCDALIFVDDDEEAPPGWLHAMLSMWEESSADIVTGPVTAILPDSAPQWAKASGAYNKFPPHPRGHRLDRAFTNNTLVSKAVLTTLGPCFDTVFRYSGSSDIHYFMKVRQSGFEIVWCPEAVIYEYVPLSRLRFSWIIKRGFRVGAGDSISRLRIRGGWKTILRIAKLGAGRCLSGGLQVALSPYTRWRGLIIGLRRFASGIGTFAGLFGITYPEYKKIHGENEEYDLMGIE